jgi:hypothetical protein
MWDRVKAAIGRWRWPLAIWFGTGAFNLWWLFHDGSPLGEDESLYAAAALTCWRMMTGTIGGSPRRFLQVLTPRQPLIAWITAPWLGFGGDVATIVRAFNLVPLLCLSLGVFALTRRLTRGNSVAAVVAVGLTNLYPPMSELSRTYWPHYALVAIVIVTLYLLCEHGALSRFRDGVYLGLAFGIGLLTRHFYVMFMAGPVLLMLPTWWRALRDRARRPAFAIMVVLTLGLALPHWIPAFPDIMNASREARLGLTSCTVPYDSAIMNWLWSPMEIVRSGSYAAGAVLVALAILAASCLFRPSFDQLLSLACGFGGLCLINLYPCKVLAYALPAVPPLVVLGVAQAARFRNWFPLAALASAIMAIEYFDDFSPPPHLGGRVLHPAQTAPPQPDGTARRAPMQVAHAIKAKEAMLSTPRTHFISIGLISNFPFSAHAMDVATLIERLKYYYAPFYVADGERPQKVFTEVLLDADYLVVSYEIVEWDIIEYRARDVVKTAFRTLAGSDDPAPLHLLNFERIATIPRGDGTDAYVYQKTRAWTEDDRERFLRAGVESEVMREKFPEHVASFAAELALHHVYQGRSAEEIESALMLADRYAARVGLEAWAKNVRCIVTTLPALRPPYLEVRDALNYERWQKRVAPDCERGH